jgi:hypothetical protein
MSIKPSHRCSVNRPTPSSFRKCVIKALLERLDANEHELVALRTARDIAFDTFTQRKSVTVNLMP